MSPVSLDKVWSSFESLGGHDHINTGRGNDFVFGGLGVDIIGASDGQNIVFGDHGRITGIESSADNLPILDGTLTHDDYPVNVLQLVEGYVPVCVSGESLCQYGGDDTITTGIGRDMVFGGAGNDTITANDGEALDADPAVLDHNNLVFGDYGFVDYLIADLLTAHGGDAADTTRDIDRVWSFDNSYALGGHDTITTGAGNDIVLGGTGDDTITSGEGGNIVLGDNGRLTSAPLAPATPKFSVHEFVVCTIETVGFADAEGGNDTIYGSPGADLFFGGAGGDVIYAGGGNDLVFGDQGKVTCANDTPYDPDNPNGVCSGLGGPIDFIATNTTVATGSGDDLVYGGSGDDIVLGQQGDDILYGEDGDDILIGGSNVAGALDGSDVIDGGAGTDAIFGDNAACCRRADSLDPRMQALSGTTIYGTVIGSNDGLALVTGTPQSDPTEVEQYLVTLLDHSNDIQANHTELWGDDYIAGGAGDDEIWGELGNDVVQGDGYVDGLVLKPYTHNLTAASPRPVLLPVETRIGAWRDGSTDTTTSLHVNPSVEDVNDGDDYIEGNGGADTIFGGLGQDDIVGDSSDLYGLTGPELRPTGSDLIFGGAGTEISRNDIGTSFASVDAEGNILTVATGHARDADTIAGDNADIFRLVGTNGSDSGAFLAFEYDNYSPDLKLIPRAVQLLDYTLGGPAYNAASAPNDRGEADELHGEAGDDAIYGMKGNDVLFGEGQDDDLIGGYGDDWMSGGTGDDGVVGDDGRILTSRNNATVGEPLYGVSKLRANDSDPKTNNGDALDEVIYTPGKIQTAVINVAGELKKAVNLTPFNIDPAGTNPLFRYEGAGYDDIIFGGLGDDVLHGASGDDAISGAEALAESYAPEWDVDADGATIAVGLVRTDYGHPFNPGDVLRWNPDDVDGWHYDRTGRSGEFALYDEYNPRAVIVFDADGSVWRGCSEYSTNGHTCVLIADQPAGGKYQYFLNNASNEGYLVNGCIATDPNGTCTDWGDAWSDGEDAIFGDLGNDWLVGGTGRDDLYGGYGNDLLQADDDLSTNGGLNDGPDTHPSYEDRAYGGAGRDILIGNTGGDRLIDWVGEFNSYIVPYAPFGAASVSRTLQPQLAEFLYALAFSDGADPTRLADEGSLTSGQEFRRGEPYGELGVVRQRDADWHAQTGGPTDPQAGNIPGGRRDVLRSANFNDGTLQGFGVDSGTWQASGGTLQVAATSLHGDAAAVFALPEYLPWYFEVQASISVIKPIAGWNANAYIIFDYQGATSFKFAGIDASINKLVMGHRDETGWIVDRQTPFLAKWGTAYTMLLAVNGQTATLVVNNQAVFSYTYPVEIVDGYSYGLNYGFVGFGSNNSRGSFDNINVQVLPPQISYDHSVEFDDGSADILAGASTGTWAVEGGRLTGTAVADGIAVRTVDLGLVNGLATSSYLQLDSMISTAWVAGFAFDVYAADDLKFAVLDMAGQRIVVGHIDPRRGYVGQASFPVALVAGVEYVLSVTLRGDTVTVSLNDTSVGSFAFNASILDGGFGTFTTGTATFDSFRIRTDDPAFTPAATPSVTIDNATINEGAAGTTVVNVPVSLSRPATTIVTMTWTTTAGTATVGSDYVGASGTLTFDPGETEKVIAIAIVGDTVVEPDEMFSVRLGTVTGADVTRSIATVTIRNDDAISMPSVSITGATLTEGASGTKTVTLTLTLSEPAATSTNVSWTTFDGTATTGSDYTGVSGIVGFAAGTTSATITVTILGDTAVEPDETFSVVLSSPVGLTLGTDTATVTIVNDDILPSVSLTAGDPNAAETGREPGVFTITRSANLSGSLVVKLTWGGTATNGTDYTVTAAGGTLSADRSTITFADGASTATITVTPVDDTTAEATESATLALAASAAYATTAPMSGTVSIVDNDTVADAPTISIGDRTVTEADKATTIKVTVTLSAKWSSAITVAWTAVSGTAMAGTDFKAASGTIKFAAGATTATISISILGDRTPESMETFTIVLSNPTGGATLGQATATVTIVDNDGQLNAAAAGPGSTTTLSVSAAEPVLTAALDDLRAAGLDVDALGPIELRVASLAGLELAEVDGGAIVLDADAAGWGWSTGLAGVEPGRIDLHSVLLHEVGHLLGLEHGATGYLREVMKPSLTPGIRVALPPASTNFAIRPAAEHLVTPPVAVTRAAWAIPPAARVTSMSRRPRA